jgi:hypothetical protein
MRRPILAGLSTFASLFAMQYLLPASAVAAPRADCAAIQSRIVDVRAFGASGDGSADDTPAVQSAADCVVALFNPDGAGRAAASLYFPKGSYRIERQIRIAPVQTPQFGGGIVIAGDGADASRLIGTSASGIFAITMRKPLSRAMVGLEVRDIDMVAGIADAGTALDVESDFEGQPAGSRRSPLIGFRMGHVNITASDPSRGHFAYGVRAVGARLAHLDDVHMSGDGATACYSFSFSYGSGVDRSSCQGAQVGVEMSDAAEGDYVTNSQFREVGTGIRIHVVPGQIPGPSNDEGMIEGNVIAARGRAIDVTNKRFVFIFGNRIHVPQDGGFEGVSLASVGQSYVTRNTFVGSSSVGTGIVLANDATSVNKPTVETTISQNVFGGLATAVNIGAGVRGTVFCPGSARPGPPVDDRGIGTVMLPYTPDLQLSSSAY